MQLSDVDLTSIDLLNVQRPHGIKSREYQKDPKECI